MPYEKLNFEDGNVLTAAQLNHMEQGIATANNVHRVSICYDVGQPPDAALVNTNFGALVAFLVSNTEIIADLELSKGDAIYRANTQTVYTDEETSVYFDFAGLGVMRVDNKDFWYFAEHNSGGSIIPATVE